MKVKDEDLERFRRENIELRRENARLARQVKELTAVRPESEPPVAESPSFVRPNVPEKIRRKPGRPVGHEAALLSGRARLTFTGTYRCPSIGNGGPAARIAARN